MNNKIKSNIPKTGIYLTQFLQSDIKYVLNEVGRSPKSVQTLLMTWKIITKERGLWY